MTKKWWVGGRYRSERKNPIVYEKVNPETNKMVKVITGFCCVCGSKKTQVFIRYITRGKGFQLRTKCKPGHCSAMLNSAWYELNKIGLIWGRLINVISVSVFVKNKNIFPLRHYQLYGTAFKNKYEKLQKNPNSLE